MPTDTLQIGVGNMIQMNVDNERRFLNVTAKRNMGGGRYQLTFSAGDTLFLHPADWARDPASAQNLQLRPAETSFQKITPVMYYRNAQKQIMRSTGLTAGGAPIAEVLADSVTAWDVWLFFADGDSAKMADPTDARPRPTTTVTWRASRSPRRCRTCVATATWARRPRARFEWRYSPRNLAYERNQ